MANELIFLLIPFIQILLIDFLLNFCDHSVSGIVNDRTDGKLVHLDGLNFSRASNLYSIIIAHKGSLGNGTETLK
jgi:hypothetical protein